MCIKKNNLNAFSIEAWAERVLTTSTEQNIVPVHHFQCSIFIVSPNGYVLLSYIHGLGCKRYHFVERDDVRTMNSKEFAVR